jgi:uncharacterized protein with PQ loop repeat
MLFIHKWLVVADFSCKKKYGDSPIRLCLNDQCGLFCYDCVMPHIGHQNRGRLAEIKYRISKYTTLTKLVLAMAIIEPLMTLPQVYEVWVKKQTQGVSLLTWSFYLIAAVIWLLYGFKIRDKPLIIASTLWIVVELVVVLGLIIY